MIPTEAAVEPAASDVTSPNGAAVVAAPNWAVELAPSDMFPPEVALE